MELAYLLIESQTNWIIFSLFLTILNFIALWFYLPILEKKFPGVPGQSRRRFLFLPGLFDVIIWFIFISHRDYIFCLPFILNLFTLAGVSIQVDFYTKRLPLSLTKVLYIEFVLSMTLTFLLGMSVEAVDILFGAAMWFFPLLTGSILKQVGWGDTIIGPMFGASLAMISLELSVFTLLVSFSLPVIIRSLQRAFSVNNENAIAFGPPMYISSFILLLWTAGTGGMLRQRIQ